MIFIPLLMGSLYLAAAYGRLYTNPVFLLEHVLVLSFWVFNTGLVMMATREILVRFHLRFMILPTVVVPVSSWFILYIIYVTALIGNFCWGYNPDCFQIAKFIPNLFNITDAFGIPKAVVVAFFIVPLSAMCMIYFNYARQTAVWHWVLKEVLLLMPRRGRFVALAVSTWVGLFFYVFTGDTSIEHFGNFSHDPIVNFFHSTQVPIAMTKERVFWIQKDMKAEQSLRPHIPKVHNVFLFVVDALRADHLPIYGYTRPVTPYLSGFLPSAHCRKIDWGLSNGLETASGLLCLLTSKEPRDFSHLNFTLPDLLADQGFNTSLILAADHHRFLSRKAFGRKIDFTYDGSDHPAADGAFDDNLVVDEISRLKPDDGGYHFFYIHLISVHQVGVLHEKYLHYLPAQNFISPKLGGVHKISREDIEQINNMYDDRILQADAVLREILTLLKGKGYLKDYVAVLTADHGQLLGDKGEFGHGYFSYPGAIRVPIVFFGSKDLPEFPETHFACQIDIAPTLADLASLTLPFSWQGQSLLRRRLNPWSYHLSPSLRPGAMGSVVDDEADRLLIYSHPLTGNPGQETLYDLDRDPREEKNLVEGFDPKLLNEFRAKAWAHFTTN